MGGSKGQSVLYFPYGNKVQLCGKYSTVMQIVIVVGVKFLSVTIVTTDFKLNPLLTL